MSSQGTRKTVLERIESAIEKSREGLYSILYILSQGLEKVKKKIEERELINRYRERLNQDSG